MMNIDVSEAISKKKEKEKQLVGEMINIFCRKKHNCCLCDECTELRDYAWRRIDKCPFTLEKTFCASCTIHCYSPLMRKRIKEVMRFSGPRMLVKHPFLVASHAIDTINNKFSEKERPRANG